MRLDLFLHRIRLVKSRTLAQGLIETGYVRVDGKRIEKTSQQIELGSIVALPIQGQIRVLKVIALPARRGPSTEARLCYKELTD